MSLRLLLPVGLILSGCSLQRGDEPADTAAMATPDPETLDAPDVGAIRVGDDVLGAGRSLTDWPATGFNFAGQRFSPLTQLTPDSVRSLSIAWQRPLAGEGDEPLDGPVATPVVSGQVLYVTGAGGWIHAHDVRSGELLWRSDETRAVVDVVAEGVAGEAPLGAPPGLALWQGRAFVARPGGELASVDAKTGRTLWSHEVAGDGGRITTAPLVAGNIVYLGVAVAGPGGERGAVVALDYAEGQERWRFYTVPAPGAEPDEAASDRALAQVRGTWAAAMPTGAAPPGSPPGGASRAIGGGLVNALAFDPERRRLLVGTGQPVGGAGRSPDFGVPTDRLFARSLLALGASDGAFVWHRLLPGLGGLDRPIALARLGGAGGGTVVALVLTGAGDQAAVSLADGALLGWRPLAARPIGPTPAAGMARAVQPAPLVLADAAYSPDARLWFVPGLPTPVGGGRLPGLTALDPATGAAAWSVAQAARGGGVLATAGGLVFQGSADGRLVALAAAGGRPVWAAPFGGPITSAPSSFLVGGRQTVAVVVDARGDRPARLVLMRATRLASAAAPQQRP